MNPATPTDRWYGSDRLGGLRRFAAAITVLNVLGHVWLGFEQAWAHPFVALAAAYGTELALEQVGAAAEARVPRWRGGFGRLVDFLLPAHITGMATSMLLYAGQSLAPIAFAAACGIASKSVLRVRVDGGDRHVFNPSNLGIAATLLLFPWVGIAPPYMFTENLGALGDWLLPAVVVVLGSILNARFTRRLPLVGAWLATFALQAWLRHALLGQTLAAALLPMTGMAFLLFTLYMVTDPPTTPSRPLAQVAFGAGVAAVYGVLMTAHVVFGLFFSLALVCAARGAWLFVTARRPVAATALERLRRAPGGAPGAIPAGTALASADGDGPGRG